MTRENFSMISFPFSLRPIFSFHFLLDAVMSSGNLLLLHGVLLLVRTKSKPNPEIHLHTDQHCDIDFWTDYISTHRHSYILHKSRYHIYENIDYLQWQTRFWRSINWCNTRDNQSQGGGSSNCKHLRWEHNVHVKNWTGLCWLRFNVLKVFSNIKKLTGKKKLEKSPARSPQHENQIHHPHNQLFHTSGILEISSFLPESCKSNIKNKARKLKEQSLTIIKKKHSALPVGRVCEYDPPNCGKNNS